MVDEMLVYEKVSKKLGGKEVLKQINLSISEGEIVGIVGANGSGKTTLLRLATGLIYPDQGEIQGGRQACPSRFAGRFTRLLGGTDRITIFSSLFIRAEKFTVVGLYSRSSE